MRFLPKSAYFHAPIGVLRWHTSDCQPCGVGGFPKNRHRTLAKVCPRHHCKDCLPFCSFSVLQAVKPLNRKLQNNRPDTWRRNARYSRPTPGQCLSTQKHTIKEIFHAFHPSRRGGFEFPDDCQPFLAPHTTQTHTKGPIDAVVNRGAMEANHRSESSLTQIC